jgi:hypothetical protein
MRIHTLKIGGQYYSLAFTTRALDGFCKDCGIPHLGALFQKLAAAGASEDGSGFAFSLEELAVLLMQAANEGERKEGREKRFSLDEAYDLMDESPGLALTLIEGLVGSIQAFAGGDSDAGEGEAKSR